MGRIKNLTPDRIENLVTELKELFEKYDVWSDVRIYFNGKCLDSNDGLIENINPADYFEIYEPHILSMSFEGKLLTAMYYGQHPELKRKVISKLRKYSLDYTFGHHWNISCYQV